MKYPLPNRESIMRQRNQLIHIGTLCVLAGFATAQPDLIVSEITSATTFGFVDGKMAYSFGTTVCNIGDDELAWIDGTNQHPLVSQTLYRLAQGQLQQIGIGFAHYPTPPLAGNACGLGCTPAGFSALGAGCSSTSSSVIHGEQGSMVPRTEIEPFSGFFPFPFTSIGQTGDAIYKRLKVNLADVSDPDALYFVESQVITSGESTPGSKANNASYRQVMFSPGSASASVIGPTFSEQPAIFAWRDHGLGIGMPDPSIHISDSILAGDGIIHVASKAEQIGIDTWQYTYLIQNQNALRGVRQLEVPGGADLQDFMFDDIEYLDVPDLEISGSDWTPLVSSGSLLWQVVPYGSFPNANAIRWGTSYMFGFSSSTSPVQDNATIGFFREVSPGDPDSVDVSAIVPNQACSIADFTGDGVLNFFDVSAFLAAFSISSPQADLTDDGLFNFFDVSAFLAAFSAGCP